MGHVVEETLNPEWDTKAEFFTLDYTKVRITSLASKNLSHFNLIEVVKVIERLLLLNE